MTVYRWIISVSLVANLVLFGLVVLKPHAADRSGHAVRDGNAGLSEQKRKNQGSEQRADVEMVKRVEAEQTLWSKWSGGDLALLGEELRKAGFPMQVRIQIVSVVVDERLRAQYGHLFPDPAVPQPYWRSQYVESPPANREAMMKAQRERERLFELALGHDSPFSRSFGAASLVEQYGELSSDKGSALTSIRRDYDALRKSIYDEAPMSGRRSEMESRLRLLQKEERADLAKVLTAEELLEHDLRSSPASFRLRDDTVLLNLSEQEYRALFPGYQAAIESIASLPGGEEAAASAAEQQMNAVAESILGPERYADYLQAKDPASKRLNQIVQRLDLPLSAARHVVAVQADITQRAEAVRLDKALTNEQRATQLAALAQEATQQITGSLGKTGYNAYVHYSGRWLTSLQSSKR
jgi:hypothetical protein